MKKYQTPGGLTQKRPVNVVRRTPHAYRVASVVTEFTRPSVACALPWRPARRNPPRFTTKSPPLSAAGRRGYTAASAAAGRRVQHETHSARARLMIHRAGRPNDHLAEPWAGSAAASLVVGQTEHGGGRKRGGPCRTNTLPTLHSAPPSAPSWDWWCPYQSWRLSTPAVIIYGRTDTDAAQRLADSYSSITNYLPDMVQALINYFFIRRFANFVET